MQSKYAWLISLADDIDDLEQIFRIFIKDLDFELAEKQATLQLFSARYEKLKGRI